MSYTRALFTGYRFMFVGGLALIFGVFEYNSPDLGGTSGLSSRSLHRYSLDAPLSDPTMQRALDELRAVEAVRERASNSEQQRFTFASPTGPITLRGDHVRELNRIYRSLKASGGREPLDSSYEQKPTLVEEEWEDEEWVEDLWNEDTVEADEAVYGDALP